MTRKITDQITYITIERNGVARTYYKTPAPNTRLSTAWDWSLSRKDLKRISFASYKRLHALMMKQYVVTTGTTMTCYYQPRMKSPCDYLTASDLWEGAL